MSNFILEHLKYHSPLDILFFGMFLGMILDIIIGVFHSLINFLIERTLYFHDKKKYLKEVSK